MSAKVTEVSGGDMSMPAVRPKELSKEKLSVKVNRGVLSSVEEWAPLGTMPGLAAGTPRECQAQRKNPKVINKGSKVNKVGGSRHGTVGYVPNTGGKLHANNVNQERGLQSAPKRFLQTRCFPNGHNFRTAFA